MAKKLITQAGFYNGVFRPAGQIYDDGIAGPDDAPAALNAPGAVLMRDDALGVPESVEADTIIRPSKEVGDGQAGGAIDAQVGEAGADDPPAHSESDTSGQTVLGAAENAQAETKA